MTMWHSKLAVVLDNFLASRKGKPDLHFWDTVALDWRETVDMLYDDDDMLYDDDEGMETFSYLTGWITTFSLFDSNGDVVVQEGADFECKGYAPYVHACEKAKKLMGEKWWHIDSRDIADNAISVPITVNDNGVAYSTRMYIGQLMSEFEEGLDREGKEKEMLEKQGIKGTKNVLTPRTDYALVVEGLTKEGKGESGSNEKEFKDL